ncbi:MAG: hypothetical protein ACP5M4_14785 [Acidobacteriaceae bacterium]
MSAIPHPIRVSLSEYLATSYRPDCDYLDPELRKAYVCSATGFQEPANAVLEIPGTPIRVILSDLFAELDRNSPTT